MRAGLGIEYLTFSGKYLNRTYRIAIAKLSAGQDGDSPVFPIEATRLKGAYVLITASALGSLGYGLALMTKAVSAFVSVLAWVASDTPLTAYLGHDHHAVHDRPHNGRYLHRKFKHLVPWEFRV